MDWRLRYSAATSKKSMPYEDFIKIDGPDLLLHGSVFLSGHKLKLALNRGIYVRLQENQFGRMDRQDVP